MKRFMVAVAGALMLTLPMPMIAAPDETQKAIIQRVHDAKRKLDAAQAAQGAERQKMMQEHMALMDQVMAQMEKAEPRAGMQPAAMREWIDEHIKLMRELMGQMMAEHHMIMQGVGGASGMGGGMGAQPGSSKP